jgi:hypothetical protein
MTLSFLQRKIPRISLGKYQFIIYTKLKLVTLDGSSNSPPSLQVMLGICIEIALFRFFKTLTHSPCIIALAPYVSWFMDPGMFFDHHVRTEVVAEVTMKMADLKFRQQIPPKCSKLSTKIHGVTSRKLQSTLTIPVLRVSGNSQGKIILVNAMREYGGEKA